MYKLSARHYDKLYGFKDYAAECARLRELIRRHRGVDGGALLDVGCGTGAHLAHLKAHFQVVGLDQSPEMIAEARWKHPEVTFHTGDMCHFDLGRTFDVVTCLFSSIGYVKTPERMRQATACLARHVGPGGLLVIEPWFTPETWHPGGIHTLKVEEPELHLVRMNVSRVDGAVSYWDFHYLVGTPEGVEHVVERHELGLFKVEEMQGAIAGAGLETSYEQEGLSGRGAHMGVRPG